MGLLDGAPGLVVVIGNWARLTARSCQLQEIRFELFSKPYDRWALRRTCGQA